MNYLRFMAMILTSVIMMFVLMYLNTFLVEHTFFSETRAYMAVLMGAVMAFIMLAFMLAMYPSRTTNAAIFAGSIVIFGLSLWLVRSQVTVGDLSYMRAMIPHHSIAIMTSSRAGITDGRVRKLADEIIYAQDKEIAEMRYLIADIESAGMREGRNKLDLAKIVSAEQAIGTPEVNLLDAEFLNDEDISQLLSSGAVCQFRYTSESMPVLAVGQKDGETSGLIKISGDLVRLESNGGAGDLSNVSLSDSGLSVTLQTVDKSDDFDDKNAALILTDMVLNLPDGQSIGYRGYYGCRG